MQIVYLSNRPDTLRDTISAVALRMPFVDRMAIVVPRARQADFGYAGDYLPVEFIHDETLIGNERRRLDHSSRDYLLRASLCDHPAIAEEFIMSDDDYRPMTAVDLLFFKSGGRYRSYYFYDLADWVFNDTAFDAAQQNTFQVLKYLGYPQLCYASHMPQIINKGLLRQARDRFSDYAREMSLCEWGTYFNHAQRHHAELFLPPEPYKTLCWPDCVTCWPRAVVPDEYVFENFSPGLYEDGGPFSHFDSAEPEGRDIRFDKILAWYRHEISVLNGDSLDNNTPLRRVLNRLARPLRRLKQVLWVREQSQILQLAERLRRIEVKLQRDA